MPDVLIRDLDAATVRRLKSSARSRGHSLQAEIHALLRAALDASQLGHLAETRRLSARWLRRLRATAPTDSTLLIRRDRDRR